MRGVRIGTALAVLTVAELPGDPATTAAVTRALGQHATAMTRHPLPGGRAAFACAVPAAAAPGLLRALARFDPVCDEDMVEVTLYGEGLRSDPVIAPTFCEAIAREGIALRLLTIGGTALSVVCPAGRTAAAVRALGEAFELPAGALTSPSRPARAR